MLSIILKILSILGIILLVLLGLILVILLLVLFFPICYRIKVDRHSAEPSGNVLESDTQTSKQLTKADAKAWWLFGLFRVRYRYPEPGTIKAKFLFFTLYDSGQNANNDFNEDSDEEDCSDSGSQDSVTAKKSAVTKSNSSDQSTPSQKANVTSDSLAQDSRSHTESAAKTPQTEQAEQSNLQNRTIFEKIQYTIGKFYDKIKNVFHKIKKIRDNIAYYKEILSEEDTKELLKHALMRLGKILKSLRPRKLRANICFGAASPDTTGYACAIYGMIAHHLGKHVIFIPDFENEILEGNIYAAGHTTVFLILWNLLIVVKDKRLWELRDKLNKRNIN